MIRVRGLDKRYRGAGGEVHVLRGVDLDITEGEKVAITGRSGSGKTTLLNVIGGLDSEWSGEVAVDGRDLHRMDDRALSDYRNQRVGFVFQAFHLLDHLSVLENAALPARFQRGKRGLTEAAARARAEQVLEQVGLADKLHALPTHLSGGQKQRVAIARALFNEPSLLVCDEPTGNLDRATGDAVLRLFRELNAERGVTLLVVTHDEHLAARLDRTVTIEEGKLLAVQRNGAAADEPGLGSTPKATLATTQAGGAADTAPPGRSAPIPTMEPVP
jgi:putative ABC transport system ATP-binding protein